MVMAWELHISAQRKEHIESKDNNKKEQNISRALGESLHKRNKGTQSKQSVVADTSVVVG